MRPAGIRRAVLGAATAVVVAAGMTACSNSDETPASVASKAGEAVDSATSKAGELVASASAEVDKIKASASAKVNEIKGGINAKADVKVGATKDDGDHVATEITATNSTGDTADYTVLVNWKDSSGNILDATVVNVDDVPAGGTKSATANSNRDLSGTPVAEIGQAVRH
ncbi:hypothetical protein ACFXOS_03005 [Streptomyces sp. NPDC059175]|uniref:hypothetical protein n=1 Tax=Streptomyces sp. NPDC059175 TaxID=3346757 RepID=UPI0036A34C74